MKFLTSTLIVILMMFYSCKNDVVEPDIIYNDTIQSFSDSLKILHYKSRIKGVIPEDNIGQPIIADKQDTIIAENGSLVAITPTFVLGKEADGFYVQIEEANHYFEIDFNSPLSGRKAPVTDGANAKEADDSSIVIQLPTLPADILPRIFTVKYSVYRDVGSRWVSNKATTYLKVVPKGSNNYRQLLVGKWNIQSSTITYPDRETTTYVKPLDSVIGHYRCMDGKLMGVGISHEGDVYYPDRYITVHEASYNFGGDNNFNDRFLTTVRRLNLDLSTCDSLVYVDANGISPGIDRLVTGRYYYNAESNQLNIVYGKAGGGRYGVDLEVYTVLELTENRLKIRIQRGTTEAFPYKETIVLTKE